MRTHICRHLYSHVYTYVHSHFHMCKDICTHVCILFPRASINMCVDLKTQMCGDMCVGISSSRIGEGRDAYGLRASFTSSPYLRDAHPQRNAGYQRRGCSAHRGQVHREHGAGALQRHAQIKDPRSRRRVSAHSALAPISRRDARPQGGLRYFLLCVQTATSRKFWY